VIAPRRRPPHQFTECVEILFAERPDRCCSFGSADQIARASYTGLMMRHEQVLVPRMKLDGARASQAVPQEVHPAFVAEHLRHEIFAKPGVVEPAFFFDRQVRESSEKSCRKESAAGAIRKARFAVNLHSLETASRRTSFK